MMNVVLPQGEFWRTLLGRRSIRRYRPDPVPRGVIERLLTAAIWAPNAHNRQAWRFAVLTQTASKEALIRAMSERWRDDLARDGVSLDEIEARLHRSRERLIQPPVLILGCITLIDMDRYSDPRRQALERIMATQSLALALGNLMLAAHHEGLGTCWVCGPLFAPEEVRAALDLPEDWEPQAVITVGWPAETRTSTRRPLEEVVVWK